MTSVAPTTHRVRGPAGEIAVHVQGDEAGPVVVMTHSILSSSRMWERQAALLASRGCHVVRPDTRGHGASAAVKPPYTMDELAADTLAVLDALDVRSAHYVGLSLGGMSGFGLGLHHSGRLASLCLCDCRADAPPAVAAPWDERIAVAERLGVQALAESTTQRWFGEAFLAAHPDTASLFRELASATSLEGFVGCARAIQGLDYLADVARIRTPTTLIVGAHDGVLPEAMRELEARMPQAILEVIPDAGHLPNVDQPAAFDAALLRHFQRVLSPETLP